MSCDGSRTYPDFFIVGAPKCGTTAMHAFLRAHPDIFMPQAKEIHFFGSDLSALQSQLTLAQHAELFRGAGTRRRVGETCIWALYSTRAAEEIRREVPEAKIVMLLRNPVEMMYALHSEFLYWGLEKVKDFRKAVQLEAERRLGRKLPTDCQPARIFLYRAVASYAEQAWRYFGAFPREQIHVILFDELQRDLPGVYRGLLEFLGVEPGFRPRFEVLNPNKRVRSLWLRDRLNQPRPWMTALAQALVPVPRLRQRMHSRFTAWNVGYAPRSPMSPCLRRSLTSELAGTVQRLSQILNRDLSPWLEGGA